MGQTNNTEEAKRLAEKDARRESQQPYATETQDRELETDHKDTQSSHKHSQETRNEARKPDVRESDA